MNPWMMALALVALSGCAAAERGERMAAAPRGAPTAEDLVPAGEPEACVQLTRIRSTHVRDDQTIDFVLTDGQVLRNTLPNRCPGLGFERAFSYSTSLSQLCNVDIITVINTGGGPRRGASCGLGLFQPVRPATPAGQAG